MMPIPTHSGCRKSKASVGEGYEKIEQSPPTLHFERVGLLEHNDVLEIYRTARTQRAVHRVIGERHETQLIIIKEIINLGVPRGGSSGRASSKSILACSRVRTGQLQLLGA